MDSSGYRYLIVFGLIVALGIISGNILGYIIAGIAGFLFLFTAFFFRDPKRKIPAGEDNIVSPADGIIIGVDNVKDSDVGDSDRVIIFMNLHNVHINRAPCSGKVEKIRHHEGKFLKAFKPEASLENERTEMVLSTNWGPVKVVQIAGIIARRIVCRAAPGDELARGQKYGIIHFGSRVEVFIPQGKAKILVKNGDKVLAGESIIAQWK